MDFRVVLNIIKADQDKAVQDRHDVFKLVGKLRNVLAKIRAV